MHRANICTIFSRLRAAITTVIMTVGLASCQIDLAMPKVCDHNVEILYHYNRENSTTYNVLPSYVHSITEYIFDGDDVLVDWRNVSLDPCENQYYSRHTLDTGRYSVIMWGNCSDINNEVSPAPVKGLTTREELLLSLDSMPDPVDDTHPNGDRLWHGYRTFTVARTGVSKVRVDAVHSHLSLTFRVRWKSAPPAQGTYTVYLEDVGSRAGFMPHLFYPYPGGAHQLHDPLVDDGYSTKSNLIIHHIPRIDHDQHMLDYKTTVVMNGDRELRGEFVTYRICRDSHPVLNIFDSQGNRVVHPDPAKEIDLWKYFDQNVPALNYTLRQEYAIDILVDGDNVWVMPLEVADWEDGGWL